MKTLAIMVLSASAAACVVIPFVIYRQIKRRELRAKIISVLAMDDGTLLLTELFERVNDGRMPTGDPLRITKGFFGTLDEMEQDRVIESCRCEVRTTGRWDTGDGYRIRRMT